MTVGTIVHHGSTNEDNATSGISHFIEHLIINKNTDNKRMLNYFNKLLDYGANYNAETEPEEYCFSEYMSSAYG